MAYLKLQQKSLAISISLERWIICHWHPTPTASSMDLRGFMKNKGLVYVDLRTYQVSLLLGIISRKVPLLGCNAGHSDRSDTDFETGKLTESVKQNGNFDAMLDLNQLEIIGQHFLQVLLAMKHNGAIDKTRAGFTALCNRLLCSSDPSCRAESTLPLTKHLIRTSDDDRTPMHYLSWIRRWNSLVNPASADTCQTFIVLDPTDLINARPPMRYVGNMMTFKRKF
eukprot:Gb_02096 [translate_table: standard]